MSDRPIDLNKYKLRLAWQKLRAKKDFTHIYELNAMKQNETPPIDVIALRAIDRTPDGKKIIVSMITQYSTERAYSVPVECLYDLIADLQKLNSAEGVTPTKSPDQPIAAPQQAKDLSRINVTVPKKWMLGSGLPNHSMVVMIFNPQTETQAGYALTATSARRWRSAW
jgi:hypothetical protein